MGGSEVTITAIVRLFATSTSTKSMQLATVLLKNLIPQFYRDFTFWIYRRASNQ